VELYKLLIRRGVDYVTHEKALVFRIAKRKIAKHFSLLERLKIFVSTTSVNDDNEEFDLTEFESEALSAEDLTIDNILYENAHQYIKSKSEDVRKVFYLKYDIGLTIPEIAQALSLSEATVRNKLYRTLKELRNLLT